MTTPTPYVVCIPSRGRAQICADKTLTTLAVNGISPECIHVYVADQAEYDLYRTTFENKGAQYGRLIVGVPGLVQQREFIEASWPEGQPVFYMDDDITRIDLSLAPQWHTFDEFICAAFAECRTQNAYIWGIYPVFNPFFRKARPEAAVVARDAPVYIVGCMYGIINRPGLGALRLDMTREDSQKEDVERTARYFLNDGVVLRFDRVGAQTKYYGAVGGLGTFKARLVPMARAAETLAAKWPELGKTRVRKNGMCEFVFHRGRGSGRNGHNAHHQNKP